MPVVGFQRPPVRRCFGDALLPGSLAQGSAQSPAGSALPSGLIGKVLLKDPAAERPEALGYRSVTRADSPSHDLCLWI